MTTQEQTKKQIEEISELISKKKSEINVQQEELVKLEGVLENLEDDLFNANLVQEMTEQIQPVIQSVKNVVFNVLGKLLVAKDVTVVPDKPYPYYSILICQIEINGESSFNIKTKSVEIRDFNKVIDFFDTWKDHSSEFVPVESLRKQLNDVTDFICKI